MKLDKLSMQFAMHDTGWAGAVLEAYERLIYDAARGDRTLFTTAQGIERLWELSHAAAGEPARRAALRAGLVGPQPDPPAGRAVHLAAAVRAAVAQPERAGRLSAQAAARARRRARRLRLVVVAGDREVVGVERRVDDRPRSAPRRRKEKASSVPVIGSSSPRRACWRPWRVERDPTNHSFSWPICLGDRRGHAAARDRVLQQVHGLAGVALHQHVLRRCAAPSGSDCWLSSATSSFGSCGPNWTPGRVASGHRPDLQRGRAWRRRRVGRRTAGRRAGAGAAGGREDPRSGRAGPGFAGDARPPSNRAAPTDPGVGAAVGGISCAIVLSALT